MSLANDSQLLYPPEFEIPVFFVVLIEGHFFAA